MTDALPFGAAEESTSESPPQSRRKAVLVAGLALASVAGAAYFLLGGSDEVLEDVALAPSMTSPGAPTASTAPVPIKLPSAAAITMGRTHPFRPLFVAPAAATLEEVAVGAGEAPPVVPLVPDGEGGAPVPDQDGNLPGGSGPSGTNPTAPSEPTAKEYELILRRVFGSGADQSAVFTVDGKPVTAKVGSTFGPTAEIKLLSLLEGETEGQHVAVLQVGDGDPFDVLTGVPAYVR